MDGSYFNGRRTSTSSIHSQRKRLYNYNTEEWYIYVKIEEE